MVSTQLKHISQIAWFPQVGLKIKKMKPPPSQSPCYTCWRIVYIFSLLEEIFLPCPLLWILHLDDQGHDKGMLLEVQSPGEFSSLQGRIEVASGFSDSWPNNACINFVSSAHNNPLGKIIFEFTTLLGGVSVNFWGRALPIVVVISNSW